MMTALRPKNYLFLFKLSLLLLFSCSMSVKAATYYVAPRATAELNMRDEGSSAWEAAQNINTPCSAKTAFKRAVAGDTVFFRGGVYVVAYDYNEHSESFYWDNGILNPSASGTSSRPIVFKNYPGETPEFRGDLLINHQYSGIFGVDGHSYITFEGFRLRASNFSYPASIKLVGESPSNRANGLKAINLTVYGGDSPVTTTDNIEGIYCASTTGTIIEHCKVYNFRQINDWHNTSGIKGYNNDNWTIRNNEIYNCSLAIYLKRDTDNSSVYNNYLHDNLSGIFIQTYTIYDSNNITIYNNIIASSEDGSKGIEVSSEEDSVANDLVVYNNTIYGIKKWGIVTGHNYTGHGAVVYNNILPSGCTIGDDATIRVLRGGGSLKECDHNSLSISFKVDVSSHIYTSLSSWQSSNELEGNVDVGCGSSQHPGCGSLASDPRFLNSSGTMSQLEDFRLATDSPCRKAGRNGADMGANIDLVGVKTGNSGGSPPPNPSNLRKLSQ